MTDRQVRFLQVVFLIFALCWFLGRITYGAEDPKPLPPKEEIHVLKVQNLQLRVTVLQQQVADLQKQVQEAHAKLEADKQALETELRTALTPPADWTFDWGRGAFVPPAKTEPPK